MEDPAQGAAKKTTIEDFTMLRLLGKGSYGDVFLMEKKEGGGIFALKTMNKVHMARVNVIRDVGKETTPCLHREGSSFQF